MMTLSERILQILIDILAGTFVVGFAVGAILMIYSIGVLFVMTFRWLGIDNHWYIAAAIGVLLFLWAIGRWGRKKDDNQ